MEPKHTPVAWDSAYPGSISPREDGQYIDREDSKSLAYALLRTVEDQDTTISELRDQLETLIGDISDRDHAIRHLVKGVDFERTMPNETRPTIREALSARATLNREEG